MAMDYDQLSARRCFMLQPVVSSRLKRESLVICYFGHRLASMCVALQYVFFFERLTLEEAISSSRRISTRRESRNASPLCLSPPFFPLNIDILNFSNNEQAIVRTSHQDCVDLVFRHRQSKFIRISCTEHGSVVVKILSEVLRLKYYLLIGKLCHPGS